MKLFLASRTDGSLELVRPLLTDSPTKMKLALITTATNPYPLNNRAWYFENKAKLIEFGFDPIEYDLFGKDITTLRRDLTSFDIIYVEGGNVFYLMNEVRKSGFDQVIKELLADGKLYMGSSAGAMVMGPSLEHLLSIDDPSLVPELTDYSGLGITELNIVPHYGREKYQKKHSILRDKYGDSLTFLRDDQAVIVNNSHVNIVTNA